MDTAKALMHLGLKSTSPKLYVPFKPKTRGRAISGELELDPIVDQSGKLPAGNPRYLVSDLMIVVALYFNSLTILFR